LRIFGAAVPELIDESPTQTNNSAYQKLRKIVSHGHFSERLIVAAIVKLAPRLETSLVGGNE
jgi:hypothetical protein